MKKFFEKLMKYDFNYQLYATTGEILLIGVNVLILGSLLTLATNVLVGILAMWAVYVISSHQLGAFYANEAFNKGEYNATTD